jgi:3-deoxy-manno-octulosonate cytidylyltransferase (CMP-KDO synthetase)
MDVLGVIPARWGSTRFEGKVLQLIDGKPMIQHVWERARKSQLINSLVIACDDMRVIHAAQNFDAPAVMTSPDHASGTDRVAEAVKGMEADFVVNIQGDEPLIHHTIIDKLIMALADDKHASMATVVREIKDEKDIANPNIVKVVIDQQQYALYFSRATIPFERQAAQPYNYLQHLGLYVYRAQFLQTFVAMQPSSLEKAESLEQLRALEAGYKIKTIKTDIQTISVDTKDDLVAVERCMKNEN